MTDMPFLSSKDDDDDAAPVVPAVPLETLDNATV